MRHVLCVCVCVCVPAHIHTRDVKCCPSTPGSPRSPRPMSHGHLASETHCPKPTMPFPTASVNCTPTLNLKVTQHPILPPVARAYLPALWLIPPLQPPVQAADPLMRCPHSTQQQLHPPPSPKQQGPPGRYLACCDPPIHLVRSPPLPFSSSNRNTQSSCQRPARDARPRPLPPPRSLPVSPNPGVLL